jgi:outer membrane protein TolC
MGQTSFAAALWMLVSAAQGAETPAPPPLSVRAVMRLAVTSSPDVLAAKARADEAGLEEPALLANTDPTIEGGYSMTDDRAPRALPGFEAIRTRLEKWDTGIAGKTLIGTETKLNFHNERLSNPSLFRPIDPTAASRLSLDFRQRLARYFWGRPDKARRRRARSNTAAAADRLRDARERAAAGAAKAFLELAFASRQRAIKADAVADAEKLLTKYEEKRRYGLAEESDLMQARASLEVQRADQLVADSQWERARFALMQALAGESLSMEGATIEGAPAETEVAEDEALSRRSDVAAARAAADAASWDARVTRLDTLPDISFVGSYAFAGLSRSRYSSSWRDLGTWDHPVYTAGAEVSIPLTFRRERLSRKAADLRGEAAKAEALRVELNARRELRDAREGLRLSRLRVAAGKRLLEAERKKYAAEEANFKRGRSSTDLLLRFQQDIRRAEIETARSETDEAAALVELARAQGRLLEGLAP